MERKLRVGVIGCGRISVMHLMPASRLPEADLIACCDVDEARVNAAAEEYKLTPYLDYKEMLAKEKLDAVHICLPHYLHVPVAKYAFERGVHVLSEKPMGVDYAEAESAVALAEKCGVLYGVIFQCRYNDAAQLVKARVNRELGRVLSARSVLTWNREKEYYDESDWKGTWDKEGGGVLIDQAIHSVDLVHWIIGEKVKSISCTMANRNHSYLDVEDSAEGLITYESGARYGFYCMNNYACDEPIELRFFCEKGMVTMSYNDAYIRYKDGKREEAHQSDEVELYKGAKAYWGVQHIQQIRQFYRACLGIEPLEISGAEALKTHALICSLYQEGKKRFYKE